MSSRLALALFALVCVAQLAVAGSGIARHERVLQQGTAYRFETAPVDPLDLFRGRYVRLDLKAAEVDLPLPDDYEDGRIYAVLDVNARGFARISALSTTRPRSGDYLHVEAQHNGRSPGGAARTRLLFPFTRFYMEESRAPETERLYRERSGAPGERPAYALVRVLDGLPVLEDLRLQE